MSAHACFRPDGSSVGTHNITAGKGTIIAVGHKPVTVSYKLELAASTGNITVSGVSESRRLALKEMWLEPVVILCLESGHHIDIAITELNYSSAKFALVLGGND